MTYRHNRPKVKQLIKEYGIKWDRAGPPRHVIILVIDCLRWDHLSLNGYIRDTTPFIDSLNAAIFKEAYSAAPWTYSSVSSLLSGLYSHNHGGAYSDELRNFNEKGLPRKLSDQTIFLSEILGHFGFKTYFSSPIVPAVMPSWGRFQVLNSYPSQDAGTLINNHLSWLKSNIRDNTFSYLHLSDVHEPLKVERPYKSVFGHISNIPLLERWDYVDAQAPNTTGFVEYRENKIRLYDSCIRYVDSKINGYYAALKKLGVLDDVLIVITADHGEEMWDHAEIERKLFYDPRPAYGIGHGHNMFQEIIKVPLLFLGKDIPSKEFSDRASLVDVVPTVLGRLGFSWDYSVDGIDLFSEKVDRYILCEDCAFGYEKKAILKGKYKLIFSEGDNVKLLFDLSKDPLEKKSLDNKIIEKDLLSSLPGEKIFGSPQTINDEVKEHLKALGYID